MGSLYFNQCNASTSFSQEEKNVLLTVYGVIGILTNVPNITAVLMVLCLRLYPQFVYRLALYQELSSIFFGTAQSLALFQLRINNTMAGYNYDVACKASAFLIQYSMVLKLSFTVWLTIHLFFFAVCLKNLQRLEVVYVISSSLIPIVPSVIPFLTDSYGVAGAWCWIPDWDNGCSTEKYLIGITEQYVLWYGPAFICLILANLLIAILILVMLLRLCKPAVKEQIPLTTQPNQRAQQVLLKQLLPLLFYPLIFFFLLLVPLSSRIYNAIHTDANFTLMVVHAFANPFWGLVSGLALIVHICIMQYQKKHHHKRHTQQARQSTKMRAVSNADTKYIVRSETSVDNSFLIKTRV